MVARMIFVLYLRAWAELDSGGPYIVLRVQKVAPINRDEDDANPAAPRIVLLGTVLLWSIAAVRP